MDERTSKLETGLPNAAMLALSQQLVAVQLGGTALTTAWLTAYGPEKRGKAEKGGGEGLQQLTAHKEEVTPPKSTAKPNTKISNQAP